MATSTPKAIYELWDLAMADPAGGEYHAWLGDGIQYRIRRDFAALVYHFEARQNDKSGNTFSVSMQVVEQLMEDATDRREVQDFVYKHVENHITGRYDADEAYSSELRDWWEDMKHLKEARAGIYHENRGG